MFLGLGREILTSGEVDALVVHGLGRPGLHNEDTPVDARAFLAAEKQMITGAQSMQEETGIPVLIGSHHCPWESQTIYDLNLEGIRIYNRLDEIAQLLSLMSQYGRRN